MGTKGWQIIAVIVVIAIAGYVLLGRSPATGPAEEPAAETTEATTAPTAATTPQAAVEAFFQLLADGKLAEAHASQASAARAEDTLAVFSKNAADAGLTTATPGAWQVGTTTESEATVTGSVTLQSGQVLPLAIVLVAEDGGWRVRAVGAAQ